MAALIFYGFSLNVSLDGLMFLPFFTYRVSCKILKNLHKAEGIFEQGQNLMYSSNNLDIGLLNALLSQLHSCMIGCVFGGIVPWIPYFLHHDGAGFFSEVNFLYDPFSKPNLYNNGIFTDINIHTVWSTLGFTEAQVNKIDVPLLLYFSWIFFTNCLVIAFSRTNKNLGSHKKHMLQVLLITQINYLFGNPKP